MADFKPALAFLKSMGVPAEKVEGLEVRLAQQAIEDADSVIAALQAGDPEYWPARELTFESPSSLQLPGTWNWWDGYQGGGFVANEGNKTDKFWVDVATAKFKQLRAQGGLDTDKNVANKKSKKKGGRAAAKKKQAQDGTIYQREQAFLLQNIQDILGKENALPPLQHHLPRLTVVSTENTLAGELLSPKEKLLSLMSVSPKDLSALTPYIRIYKRDKDISTGKTRIREFKFSSHSPDLYEYLKHNSKGSGANIGLKSFNFEMTGDNDYTSTRKMKSELVLYFKSFNELGTSESDDETIGWQELLFAHNSDSSPALDALLQSIDDDTSVAERAAKEELLGSVDRSAQILVELGYNFSDKIIEDQELRDAVVDSRMLLGINPTTNDFNFSEDGSSEVNLGGIAQL